MKPPITPHRNHGKAQLLVDAAVKRMRALHAQGHYAQSLDICLQIIGRHPKIADAWSDAAVNSTKLERWQDAIRYGNTALKLGSKTLALFDALAHVHGHLRQWDEMRRYGLQALNMRAQRFGGEPPLPAPAPGPLPPLPSAQTREHNIIAFSLFGGNSKYCEPAVLNVLEQPHIYPHWVCRFYVDDSVPEHVTRRLREGGAQVVAVDATAARWPGPMWRFLVLDDPQMHRALFRDADSVISQREAEAVHAWLDSGKRFHVMRDNGSHTELMLAGLWGVVSGSLPPLAQLMQRFLSAPIESAHFADQYFLRKYIWPYARASLLQHDSMFGFMNGIPFPSGARPDDFHVGYAEGSPFFTAQSNLPEGSQVIWELSLIETPQNGEPPREQQICAYPGTVENGAVVAHLPARYARRLQQGTARIRVVSSPGTADNGAP